MCAPALAVPLIVGSGIYTAYNQYQEGRAGQKYYNYLADQNEQEARLALDVGKQRSEAALEQGRKQSGIIQDTQKIEGKQLSTEASQFNASQRAAMAALGVSGVTAEALTVDSFNKQKIDEANLRYNADLRSYQAKEGANIASYEALTNADQEAWYSRTLASQNRYAGKVSRQAGNTQAFGTILSTAATVGMMGGGAGKPSLGSQTKAFGGGVRRYSGPSASFNPLRVR